MPSNAHSREWPEIDEARASERGREIEASPLSLAFDSGELALAVPVQTSTGDGSVDV